MKIPFPFCRNILCQISYIAHNQRSGFVHFQRKLPIKVGDNPIGTSAFFHNISTNQRFSHYIFHHSRHSFLSRTGLRDSFLLNKIDFVVPDFKSKINSWKKSCQCLLQCDIFELHGYLTIHIDQLVTENQAHTGLAFNRCQNFFHPLILKI